MTKANFIRTGPIRRALLIALAALASFASRPTAVAATPQRLLGAHHMVAFPWSTTNQNQFDEEARRWKTAGWDFVVLHMDAYDAGYPAQLRRYYDACEKAGIKATASWATFAPNDPRGDLLDLWIPAIVRDTQNHPAQWKIDGVPVYSAFNLPARSKDILQAAGLWPVKIWAHTYYYAAGVGQLHATADPDVIRNTYDTLPWLEGLANFSGDMPASQIEALNDLLVQVGAERGKLAMAGVTPLYGSHHLWDMSGFRGLESQWRSILRNPPNAVWWVTSNDFNEISYISDLPQTPVWTDHWNKNHMADPLDHSGYRKFAEPFVAAYKAGQPVPTFSNDRLFLTYQLHPKNATPVSGSPDHMYGGRVWRDLLPDKIFASAHLTLPAQLRINGVLSQEFPAGVAHFEVPLTVGSAPEVAIVRNGVVVKSGFGPLPITNSPTVGAWNYLSIEVAENQAPTQTAPVPAIVAPASGDSFTAGDSIRIDATVSGSTSALARVEFYDGSLKIGEDTTAPYSLTWNDAPAGTRFLTATSVTNDGRRATSETVPINVTVPNTGPADYEAYVWPRASNYQVVSDYYFTYGRESVTGAVTWSPSSFGPAGVKNITNGGQNATITLSSSFPTGAGLLINGAFWGAGATVTFRDSAGRTLKQFSAEGAEVNANKDGRGEAWIYLRNNGSTWTCEWATPGSKRYNDALFSIAGGRLVDNGQFVKPDAYSSWVRGGYAVRFHTNARRIYLYLWLDATQFRVIANGKVTHETLDDRNRPQGTWAVFPIEFDQADEKDVEILFDNDTPFVGVVVPPAEGSISAWQGQPWRKTMAVIGDSITEGGTKGYGWSAAHLLNLDGIVRPMGSTGYLDPGFVGGYPHDFLSRLEKDLLQHNPDIVVVSGGVNDQSHPGDDINDPVAFENAVRTLFDRVDARLPSATKVALSPFWPNQNFPAVNNLYTDIVRRNAQARGWHFIDFRYVQNADTTRFISGDGIHPNPEGWSYLGARLAADLAPIVGGSLPSTTPTTPPSSGSDGGSGTGGSTGGDSGSSGGSTTPPATTTQQLLSNSGWRLVSVDSEETSAEDGRAINAFDGKANTFWHTKWAGSFDPVHPHDIRIDLGASHTLSGFEYLPRQDGSDNGNIARYEFYVSHDGANWGSPVAAGTFPAGNSRQRVAFSPQSARYVRLRALSEENNNPWTCVAELGVLHEVGGSTTTPPSGGGTTDPGTTPPTGGTSTEVLSRSDWSLAGVDSEENSAEDGRAINAFDGKANTFWHTKWAGSNDPLPPHDIRIDLGASRTLSGFEYLPRQDGSTNGHIARYEFYVSPDGTNWGSPVASGTFDSSAAKKTVPFSPSAGRYIRLRALSAAEGNPWTCVAELNVLHEVGGTGSDTGNDTTTPPTTDPEPPPPTPPSGSGSESSSALAPLSKATWSLHDVDSEETSAEDGRAVNAFDGRTNTFWHTKWAGSFDPVHPHDIRINLGATATIGGFEYLPRQDGSDNGNIARYEFYTSTDGTNWNGPVASGTFAAGNQKQRITFAAHDARYIRLRSLSEQSGAPWACVAEIDVLAASGTVSPPSTTPTPPPPSSGGTGSEAGNMLSADIGDPFAAGLSVYDSGSGTYLVEGGGNDIWGPKDEAHFVYREVTGDVRITVRVDQFQQDHAWAKAGPMMRASLDGGSTHASMFATGGVGTVMQWRTSASGESSTSGRGPGAAPRWLRLERRGNVFTGYQSADGVNWSQIGTATVIAPSKMLVGFAVTAHTWNTTATAFFSNITIE